MLVCGVSSLQTVPSAGGKWEAAGVGARTDFTGGSRAGRTAPSGRFASARDHAGTRAAVVSTTLWDELRRVVPGQPSGGGVHANSPRGYFGRRDVRQRLSV